jgi:hypothetical protein
VDFLNKHWGDLASVLSLAVTFYAAAMAKRAASVAQEVKDRMSSLDTLADVSAAIGALQEILRLQRAPKSQIVWEIVLDRYSAVQSHIARIEAGVGLSTADRLAVATAAAQFRIIVRDIEGARSPAPQAILDTVRFNQVISDHIGTLEKARIGIKKAGA